ncbi:GAP family protein [Mycobacterium simiae]|uniref:GAP family protein n=1 Tax=Mycobacterium simiae TaxID=1784 RepID=UPI00165EEDFB|nr:GAP family protein [Mycobacterium simiae]
MWGTVLVLALVATADPVRIGISVLLSSRPHAAGPLVAFWLGGVATSVALAVGVLFGLRHFALETMHRVERATASPTAGQIQIAMGVLALLIAGFAGGISPRQRNRLSMPGASPSQLQVLTSNTISRVSTRAQFALQARPLQVAFLLGVGMLVDLRFLVALTAILTSGAAAGTQISAAGVYTVVALAFIELPLASQLAAPAKTGQMMSAVQGWAKARRQQIFALVIAMLGLFLMTNGMGHA